MDINQILELIDLNKLPIYFLIINLITFFLYWKDKRAAKYGKWRVPESSLLLFTFIGGTPAALFAQKTLRHKSRKATFRSKMLVVTVAQIFIVVYFGFNWWLG